MSDNIFGGCFCGKIRYQISGEPVLQLMCFCKDCLAITSTDGYAGYMVKEEDFRLIEGAPSTHEKFSSEGRKVIRHFCGTCGTNLFGKTSFGIISVAAGTLDDPGLFTPDRMAFAHQAPKWARFPANSTDL